MNKMIKYGIRLAIVCGISIGHGVWASDKTGSSKAAPKMGMVTRKNEDKRDIHLADLFSLINKQTFHYKTQIVGQKLTEKTIVTYTHPWFSWHTVRCVLAEAILGTGAVVAGSYVDKSVVSNVKVIGTGFLLGAIWGLSRSRSPITVYNGPSYVEVSNDMPIFVQE